jgi:hypothetical protein
LICKSKKKGELGLKDLSKFNINLMCKWWWKLESGAGPWQEFMRRKYLRGAGIFYFRKRPGDSPLWSDIMKVKSLYLCGKKCMLTMAADQFLM